MSKSVKDIFGDMSNKVYKDSFSCSYDSNLTSLKGSPKEVQGDFYCTFCKKLETLEGSPEKVQGIFYCDSNPNLKSLKGAPKYVGDFDCSICPKITSLDELIYNETVIQGNIICDKKLQREADDYNKNLKLYKKLGEKKFKAMKNLMNAINA